MVGRMQDAQSKPSVAASNIQDHGVRSEAVCHEKRCQFVTDLDELFIVLAHEAQLGGRQRRVVDPERE